MNNGSIYKKFFDSLTESEKLWKTADHLVYVTFPYLKDMRIFARALENMYKSLALNISTILKYEYLFKRVNLSENPKRNLETFLNKCAFRYGFNEGQCKIAKELLFLGNKHKESGFEFSKNGKVIILDDDLRTYELRLEKLKEYLKLGRLLIESTKQNFNANL